MGGSNRKRIVLRPELRFFEKPGSSPDVTVETILIVSESLRSGCWRRSRRDSEGGEAGPEEVAERPSQALDGSDKQ